MAGNEAGKAPLDDTEKDVGVEQRSREEQTDSGSRPLRGLVRNDDEEG